MMRFLMITLMMLFAHSAYAGEWTEWFKINGLFVSSATNLHFRVSGTLTMDNCPNGASWAYIDENDSGAKGKMSALLSAYASGKDVSLFVVPKDYYGNGSKYCHILELRIKG
jgi:hypothetical protein